MAKATYILDTSVLVDMLHELDVAKKWFDSMDASHAAITVISMMEILVGAANRRELAYLGRFLARFQHLHLNHRDSQWALLQLRTFWLSHQIGINDCLIASIAVREELPVYTLNIRDFAPLPNINAIRPY